MIANTFLNIPDITRASIHIWPYDHKTLFRILMHYELFSWGNTSISHHEGGNTRYHPAYSKSHQQAASWETNLVCLARFTTITIQWHLGMLMEPISPIAINVITSLPKYTLNKIMHIIHRKSINPANQSAFRPHKQIWYESLSDRYIIPRWNNFFQECI